MGKVTFSARKDPLLPTRPTTADNATADRANAPTARAKTPAAKPTRSRRAGPAQRNGHAVEEPAGVIAIDTPGPPTQQSPVGAPEPAARSARARHLGRRVQTSISLPPNVWDTLDELGEGVGVAGGELLSAILTAAAPSTPQDALTALEQLLVDIPPDDGPHEERNYRLPLELRAQLDVLVKALGAGPRAHRSLLIRALLATHTPPDIASARELITARRIDAMRAAMLAAGSD
jgi:hypothetical protein